MTQRIDATRGEREGGGHGWNNREAFTADGLDQQRGENSGSNCKWGGMAACVEPSGEAAFRAGYGLTFC
ncbi:hypothetical protein [Paraburkholderia sp. HP33-1]|uniref:hypothetical protein n=1 Tax=Paraburkholderia sp. HP33-1 TaxID=2883243 RepID=UPI001F1E41DF|nr:hypothetical protein [Paraburkholderia sp. HP33-1]